MSSNSVCNHTSDWQIGLPLHCCLILLITYMITNPKQWTPPGPITIINYHNIFSPLKHLSHLWKVLCFGCPPPSPSLPHSPLATACFCIKICPSKNNKPSKLEIVATKVVGWGGLNMVVCSIDPQRHRCRLVQIVQLM